MPIPVEELEKRVNARQEILNSIKVEAVKNITESDLPYFTYNQYGIITNEDVVKKVIQITLMRMGFQESEIEIKWGQQMGIDIEAINERIGHYVIEVKPEGKYDPMSGNYFLNAMSELIL